MRTTPKGLIIVAVLAVTLLALSSCSVTKYLPDDGYLLDEVEVVSTDKKMSSS